MAFEKRATRSENLALIGLYGGSSAGKTLSALLMARGLVGPEGNVFLLDTENKRGSYYEGWPGLGEYFVEDLQEPFSSDRYGEKMAGAISAAGDKPTALVIDSMSHEWEGPGGVLWSAEKSARDRAARYGKEWNGATTFGDWNKPKQAHKVFQDRVVRTPIHIIACFRAAYKSHQIERKDYEKHGIPANTKANTTVIKDEFQTPVQDASFIYEMLVNIELSRERPGVPIIRKQIAGLEHAFPNDRPISIETGQLIRSWINGAAPEPLDADELIKDGMSAAVGGTYEAWFKALGKEGRTIMVSTEIDHPADSDRKLMAHDLCKEMSGQGPSHPPQP
jgi:hypothetical protein